MKKIYAKASVVFLLILILAIAAFFRLWQIDAIPPGLYPDEAMNGNNALEALETGEFKIFYPENNGREGLFINMQAASLKIFGNKPLALRLPSILFGVLTILGLYFLTKILFETAPPQTQNSPKESLRLPTGQAKLPEGIRRGGSYEAGKTQNHNLKFKTFLNFKL